MISTHLSLSRSEVTPRFQHVCFQNVTLHSRHCAEVWNDTTDVDFGRPMNIMFLERLLASEHRVANPEEADYFFIPMVGGAKPMPLDAILSRGLQHWQRPGNRLDGVRYLKNHPVYREYWRRHGGGDHFTIGADDAGARAYWLGHAGQERQDYPDEAMKVIFLSHMVRAVQVETSRRSPQWSRAPHLTQCFDPVNATLDPRGGPSG